MIHTEACLSGTVSTGKLCQIKNLLTNLGSTSLSELVEDGPIVGVPLSPIPLPYEEN